ncbi:peroxisomal acyl-coenzyme A oxidase 1-like [Ptychodera flava]|uniref:peroxisomal acyl-coenzyme A oxidase 1-like n=1 Tax=Ptychodera flava TaxID=63121 RepID=UPI00396A20B5
MATIKRKATAQQSPTNINPDIQKERDSATFNVYELTTLIDCGEDRTIARRKCQSLALDDPELKHKPVVFMSRDERYTNAIKKAIYVTKKIQEHGITDMEEQQWYQSAATKQDTHGFTLHYNMFLPTLSGQGDEEQKKYWIPLAQDLKIIGTYAQTELGHGTFIRGLETTAIYDPKTEEFVLHSPTLTSLKWWPGNLGKTVTHTVVLAQLYTKGVCHGLHLFVVQLRSLKDHQPLPGVKLGDIGPKLGYASNDNGFVGFDHVRIPRRNMLMKHSKVDTDGTYTKPATQRLSYGTMVLLRVSIVHQAFISLASATTIAVRYSAVRRQTELTPGGVEPQILDYQSQQMKLFPLVATAYAFNFAAWTTRLRYIEVIMEINSGNIESLPELHALSAGLKAFTSYVMNEGIEVCRMSCGGHGYSCASGFPELYGFATPACTYEGENTVMLLQTARYLMKCAGKVSARDKLPGMMQYLSQTKRGTWPAREDSDMMNLQLLSEAYQHRAFRMVVSAAEKLNAELAKGKPQHEAWNHCHIYLLKAATAHCHFFVVQNFANHIKNTEMGNDVREVLTTLCQLYSLHGIMENSGDFLMDGYVNGDQLAKVQKLVAHLLSVMRPNAVALVDAFDIHDDLLCSEIGRYDGNVYEALYEWAKQSPLNETEVHHSYYKYLRPMLQGSKAKL